MTSERKITYAASVLSFLLGVLLGPGCIWSYGVHQRDTSRLRQEEAASILQLSSKLNELYDEIVTLTNEYLKALSDNTSNPNAASQQKMGEADVKLATLEDAYNAVESQLARMLEREPRPLQLDFIRPETIMDFR